jgi:hypothetical protein
MTEQILQMIGINKFKVGDIIINQNVGLLNEVIEVRWNGMLIVKPLVWKDYYRDPLARESCVNSFYFRKATKQDFKDFQSRGIIQGHPIRYEEEMENYLNSNKLKKEDKNGL